MTDPYEADQDVDPQISKCKKLLQDQLPDLVRLASQCPYEDVREGCSKVLLDVKVRQIQEEWVVDLGEG